MGGLLMVIPIDWSEAWNLEDYVIDLFKKKMTESSEFKTLLKIYGRKKLEEIWNRYQKGLRRK
jgi:hypothetical protein